MKSREFKKIYHPSLGRYVYEQSQWTNRRQYHETT